MNEFMAFEQKSNAYLCIDFQSRVFNNNNNKRFILKYLSELFRSVGLARALSLSLSH